MLKAKRILIVAPTEPEARRLLATLIKGHKTINVEQGITIRVEKAKR